MTSTGSFQLAELGAFLRARRGELSPADLGLPGTARRRVTGLRREEVAGLAAISTDYYTRIEQGRRHPPNDVLGAIADVLQLDPDQRQYAFELARASTAEAGRPPGARRSRQQVPTGVQALMDTMLTAPVVVQNGRLDIVGANGLGRALFANALESPNADGNLARFVFLDVHATEFYVQWDRIADLVVAILRVEAGRSPYSKDLTDLIGELATRSDEFKTRWAAHEVRVHRRGTKHLRHPTAGDLTLRYEALEIPDSDGLTLFGYTAEPGSASEHALQRLAKAARSTPDAPVATSRGKPPSSE